ncbi:IS1 family transposase, partial [Dysgonomonas sp. Marseille-P4677]|uniref:IS1 family transposase n=1 Tax=Dysgonomonas sp. Marseille-P4677 TaxID=2364790 RepID=UPI00191361B8
GKVKKQSTGIVATDYWRVYNETIPEEKLVQTKAETYTVESYNALIRHFLARFRRNSKCYSKSSVTMELSLKLLMAKRNKLISIQSY